MVKSRRLLPLMVRPMTAAAAGYPRLLDLDGAKELPPFAAELVGLAERERRRRAAAVFTVKNAQAEAAS